MSANCAALASRIDTADALCYLCATRLNFPAQDAAVLQYLSDSLRAEQPTCVEEAEHGAIMSEEAARRESMSSPGAETESEADEDANPTVPDLGEAGASAGDE